MADAAHGPTRRQLSGSPALGLNSDLAGRGPVYERVQRLLEERRARAQALSEPASPEQDEATFGSLGRDMAEPWLPHGTGENFAFDRPFQISGVEGIDELPEGLRESRSSAPKEQAQRSWHSSVPLYEDNFEAPPGHLDREEELESIQLEYSHEPGPSSQQSRDAQGYPQEPAHQGTEFKQRHSQEPGLGSGQIVSEDQSTLAELEKMLNQTMQQLNLATDTMRVPSSKDMAFGMAHEGPFDISDIWAMESQISGSQPSGSHRQASQSGGGSRDDGQEANSYSERPPTPSRAPSLTGRHTTTPRRVSRQSIPEQLPGRGRQLPGRPASALDRVQPTARPMQPQPQQPSERPVSAAPATATRPADPPRRQQRPASPRPGILQQAQSLRQPLSPGRNDMEPAIRRRTSTSGGGWTAQHQRLVQPRVSPRYQQPKQPSVSSPRDQTEELTFRPQINPRSREIAERLRPMGREQRLEMLSKPRNDRLEQRYEQIRQAKVDEELRDCTFQPQIGRPPSAPRLRSETPVHDRLYQSKPAWQSKREEILREREEAVLASCTFQPKCGSRSSSAPRRRPASAAAGIGYNGTPYVPIHQRVADLLRSRNEKLARVQVKMELGGGSVTFQPEINRRSVHLAAERQRQQAPELAALPANERLYRLAQEQAAERRRTNDGLGSSMRDVSAMRDQRRSLVLPGQQQTTGVPAINPRSRALAESSDLPQDFLARQAYLAALGHEKRALYRSLLEESTCTFQPQLLSRAGSLGSSCGLAGGSRAGSGHWSASGGDGDRLVKLAYEDVQRSAARRDALEQHLYGKYTFTPNINNRSRRIGRRHSLTDLYRNEERQAKLERLAAAAEAERSAECTFRPAINPRSASLGRLRRGSLVLASTEVHEQANKLRSSILTEARALREYEELKECTFTPAINRTTPKPPGPVAVPGLGRHLELRELARKKRDAEEARKAEVWNARPKSPGPRAGVTVPQPFSFEARVLPWQMPRAQLIQQQQEEEQNQRKALAALKQQRQQQRRDADDRRSAQLQRIMQEVQANNVSQANVMSGAVGSPMPHRTQVPAGPHHHHQPRPESRPRAPGRRSVTFHSPAVREVRECRRAYDDEDAPAANDVGSYRQSLMPAGGSAPYGGSPVMDSFGGFGYINERDQLET